MVVVGQENSWVTFITQLIRLMDEFEEGTISLENLYGSLWKFSNSVKGSLLEACFDTCTEIGGSPGHYAELRKFVSSKPSQQKLIEFCGV